MSHDEWSRVSPDLATIGNIHILWQKPIESCIICLCYAPATVRHSPSLANLLILSIFETWTHVRIIEGKNVDCLFQIKYSTQYNENNSKCTKISFGLCFAQMALSVDWIAVNRSIWTRDKRWCCNSTVVSIIGSLHTRQIMLRSTGRSLQAKKKSVFAVNFKKAGKPSNKILTIVPNRAALYCVFAVPSASWPLLSSISEFCAMGKLHEHGTVHRVPGEWCPREHIDSMRYCRLHKQSRGVVPSVI